MTVALARPFRGNPSIELPWTPRFVGATALTLLYLAIQSDWFGLVPGTAGTLVVQGTWLGLTGWWALRIGATGLAAGLVIAPVLLFLDQMTAVVGVPPAPTAVADDYWVTNTLRVGLALALYVLGVRFVGMRLPRALGPAAVPLVLAPLPFVRYYDALDLAFESLRQGIGGIILPVPWLQAMVAATLVALLLDTLAGIVPGRAGMRPLLIAVVILTAGVPGAGAVRDAFVRNTSVVLSPSSGGPLEVIRLQTAMDRPSVRVTWDGGDAVDLVGAPIAIVARGGIFTTFIVPALQSATIAGGAHRLEVRAGDEIRAAVYTLSPAGGLTISLVDRHVEVRGGSPVAPLQLLIDGRQGPEQLVVAFDETGTWRSDKQLPTGVFTIVAQSQAAWTHANVSVP